MDRFIYRSIDINTSSFDSDPADNGSLHGTTWPHGPYQPSDVASFGTVYMGNGDPSTPDDVSVPQMDRLAVEMVFSEANTRNILPQIISVPISANMASELLSNVVRGAAAETVFDDWIGGGLNTTYLCGVSQKDVLVENKVCRDE